MALIFAFSSFPMPPGTEDLPDWVSHPLAWLVLAVLVARALHAQRSRHVVAAAFAICVAYGVSDEVHQRFVPSRSCDPMDVVKDALGTAAGLAVWRLAPRRFFSEVT